MPRTVENILPSIWTLLLVLTCITVQAQVKDCTESLRRCEETFKTNILGPLNSRNKTKICSVYVVFKKCLDDLGCPIALEDKLDRVEKYRKELQKYNYSCDMEETTQRKPEVKNRSRTRPAEVEDRENEKCYSLIQSCKNEFIQSLHPYSGNSEAIEKNIACNIAKTFIKCTQECASKSTSVCEEFQNRSIHCGSDFTPCAQTHFQPSNTDSGSSNLQNAVIILSIVPIGATFWF